jgi:hypothetical protein
MIVMKQILLFLTTIWEQLNNRGKLYWYFPQRLERLSDVDSKDCCTIAISYCLEDVWIVVVFVFWLILKILFYQLVTPFWSMISTLLVCLYFHTKTYIYVCKQSRKVVLIFSPTSRKVKRCRFERLFALHLHVRFKLPIVIPIVIGNIQIPDKYLVFQQVVVKTSNSWCANLLRALVASCL